LILSSGKNTAVKSNEYEWINILKKELGYFSVEKLNDNFSFKNIDAPLLFLSSEALNEISLKPLLIKELEFLAEEKGATLFLEFPDNSYEFITGVVSGAESYLNIDEILIHSQNEEKIFFPSLEVMLPYRSVITTSDDSNINLSLGRRCLMFFRRLGKGNIISIFFPLSKWRRLISSGIDNDDDMLARMLKSISKLKHFQSCDLSLLKERRYEDMPFLDVLERFIIDKAVEISSIPRWWYYPYCTRSAVILTFDEDYSGDEIKTLLMKDFPEDLKFTIFFMSSTKASKETFAEILKNNGEIGVHWNRFRFHITAAGFHYEKNKSLLLQKEILESMSTNNFSNSSRIHYLLCDYDPFYTFHLLNCANIRVDSTWGPGRDMGGYIFGTGFPYHSPEKNGQISNLYEFPFIVHEPQGNLSLDEIRNLLSSSLNKYHSPAVILFHPHFCIGNDNSSKKFKSIIKYLHEKDGFWKTSISEFIDFYEKRAESELSFRRIGERIEIECNVEYDGLTLMLPSKGEITKIEVDGNPYSSVNISGREMISLKKGKHLIKVE
ncbi:MAG: hypothetical protein D6734_03725, partial [Candidatus Schekmanbacteria bacterium]